MQGDGVLLKLFMPQVWFGLHWNLNRNYFLPPPMIIAQVANKKKSLHRWYETERQRHFC